MLWAFESANSEVLSTWYPVRRPKVPHFEPQNHLGPSELADSEAPNASLSGSRSFWVSQLRSTECVSIRRSVLLSQPTQKHRADPGAWSPVFAASQPGIKCLGLLSWLTQKDRALKKFPLLRHWLPSTRYFWVCQLRSADMFVIPHFMCQPQRGLLLIVLPDALWQEALWHGNHTLHVLSQSFGSVVVLSNWYCTFTLMQSLVPYTILLIFWVCT
jgi:hypothetical protein